MPRLTQSVAVGVGAAGALVDVSTSANLVEGAEYSAGRDTGFDEADAGEFSFVLDNADGRFTPGNESAAVAAGFSQSLVEGAAACWQLGSRLVAGRVVSVAPEFPDDESAWALVRVTCEDTLGDPARVFADSLAEGMVAGLTPVASWLFNDPVGSGSAAGSGSAVVAPFSAGGNVTFGVTGFPGGPATQAQFTAAAGTSASFTSVDGLPRTGIGNYYRAPNVSLSSFVTGFGFVVTPLNGTTFFEIVTDWMSDFRIGIQNTNIVLYNQVTSAYETVCPITANEPMAIWVGNTGSGMQVYVNGVLVKTAAGLYLAVQNAPSMTIGNASYGDSSVLFSSLIGGVTTPFNLGGGTTISERLTAISQMTGTTITTDGTIWTAPIGPSSRGSGLDMLNELATTEQGYLYARTSGTLTAPTSEIVFRARTRPTAVTATFNVEDDLDGAPELVRDLTNFVTSVRVDGADDSVSVSDATLADQIGAKNTTETTVLEALNALRLWGQDRLIRGTPVRVPVSQATIDAMTTSTDRSTDLLSLRFGDRIRFTGLPDGALGFDQWDGWLVGVEETHTLEDHIFDLKLQPVLDPVPVFNDARFAAGTSLTLSAGINSSVTSVSVATTNATFTTDANDLPVDILIDSEQMTVTAVSSATPQVFTVTRGVNGTTAASHLSAAQVELATIEPTADATVMTNYATNPQFQVDATGMATQNGGGGTFTYARAASSAYDTAYAGRATVGTGTTSASIVYINPVIPDLVTGSLFYYAVYCRPSASVTARVRLLSFANADGTGSSTAFDGSDLALTSGAYNLLPGVAGTVDAGRLSVRPAVRIATSMLSGVTLDFKVVLVKGGTDAVTPFTGDTISSGSVFYSWGGVRYLSASYRISDGQVQPATFGF